MPNIIKYLLFVLLGVVLTLGVFILPKLYKAALGDDPKETYQQDFIEMALAGDIRRVHVITNRNIVKITLSETALQKEDYKEIFGEDTNRASHYFMNIASIDSFERDFSEIQSQLSDETKISYDVGQKIDFSGVIFTWGSMLVVFIIGLLMIIPIYMLIFKLIKRL